MNTNDLEQEILRLSDLNENYVHLIKQRDICNKALKEKLHIAVKALEEYANQDNWRSGEINGFFESYSIFGTCGYSIAEETLAKIKGD